LSRVLRHGCKSLNGNDLWQCVTLVSLVTQNRGPFRSRRPGRRDVGILRGRMGYAPGLAVRVRSRDSQWHQYDVPEGSLDEKAACRLTGPKFAGHRLTPGTGRPRVQVIREREWRTRKGTFLKRPFSGRRGAIVQDHDGRFGLVPVYGLCLACIAPLALRWGSARSEGRQAMMSLTTVPWTSVRRKSRPA
jgi:hypothetical protein